MKEGIFIISFRKVASVPGKYHQLQEGSTCARKKTQVAGRKIAPVAGRKHLWKKNFTSFKILTTLSGRQQQSQEGITSVRKVDTNEEGYNSLKNIACEEKTKQMCSTNWKAQQMTHIIYTAKMCSIQSAAKQLYHQSMSGSEYKQGYNGRGTVVLLHT